MHLVLCDVCGIVIALDSEVSVAPPYGVICPLCRDEFGPLWRKYKRNPAVFYWFAYHLKLWRRLATQPEAGMGSAAYVNQNRFAIIMCAVCGKPIELPNVVKTVAAGWAHVDCT